VNEVDRQSSSERSLEAPDALTGAVGVGVDVVGISAFAEQLEK
jgi:hypothetical protein